MEVFGVVINAVQAFDSCITAYKFICTAQDIGQDGSQILSRLQWQHYRVLQWGQRAGIDSNTPSDRLNWTIAAKVLHEQEELLTSADKLKTRYKLDIDEESPISPATRQNPAPSGLPRVFRRLVSESSRENPTSPRELIQRRNHNPIRRLRWASIGKDQTDRVLRDISELNDRLDYLLDSADRAYIHATSTAVLRDIISRCSDPADINTVQSLLNPSTSSSTHALAAAASLREIRLLLITKKKPELKPDMHLLELRPRRLRACEPSQPLLYSGIEVALYNGQKIIVEWRAAAAHTWDLLAANVRRLALLLSRMDHPSFHTLPWHGLLAWREQERFGYVYRLPDEVVPHSPTSSWRYATLQKIICKVPMSPLQRRVEIARQMADTVLQLHTAGWLHKGIRSDNILLFAADGKHESECEGKDESDLMHGTAYLVGFEYARPDSTEGAAITQLPMDSARTDLYRHPGARGAVRRSFRKGFDMYALGCLLLELAIWKPLQEVVAVVNDHGDGTTDPEQVRSFLSFGTDTQLQSLVTHHAGSTFCQAIALCFGVGLTRGDSLDMQNAVVEKLNHVQI